MAIDIGGPGISGFGYGNQTPSDHDHQPRRADNDQAPPQQSQTAPETKATPASETLGGNGTGASHATNGGAAHASAPESEPEIAEEATKEFSYDQVPGFEASASDCVNRARQIARSLNHATFSSDHLMLALTMDHNARRQLERIGDVTLLRAAAMRKLGKNYNKSDAADQSPTPTSDLADIGKKARDAAAEREQLVSISDLINAFPKDNGRLTYGSGESSRAVAVMETFETRVIPGLNEAMRRIENSVFEAMQRQHQSVQSILADLSSRQSQAWEHRQREFMDEIRRQVREAADAQFATVLKDLNEKFEQKIAESKPEPLPVSTDPFATGVDETRQEQDPEPPKSSWNWLGLIL